MALFTYHLSSVSNLHPILRNLLLLVRLDVGPWSRTPSPWPWLPQVLVNITAPTYANMLRHRAIEFWKVAKLLTATFVGPTKLTILGAAPYGTKNVCHPTMLLPFD